MRLPEFSLHQRKVILFALAVTMLGGIYAYFSLGKLEDPNFTIKTALIVTPYPGASPHEVEQQVSTVIEEAVQGADEVEHIRSVSRAGLSLVYVDLYERNRSEVIQQLWDKLRREVTDCQGELPAGAGPSRVVDDYGDVFGIFLALTGDGYDLAELKRYADFFKRELMLIPDVASIDLYGTQTECIDIEISRARCAALGIHPGRIAETLGRQNEVVAAGSLEAGDRRVRIHTPGAFSSLEEIGELVIHEAGGEQVLLRDLADVSRTFVDPPEPMMRFEGRPAVGVAIATVVGGNVVTMGDAVQSRIDELMTRVPQGIELTGVYYQSRFVKGAIGKFMLNLAEAVAIVVGILLLTMGLRSGFIIAGNLVLAILGTLVVMLVWGIDLQRISLSALILVMGMIVDNAIVVTDGALVRLQKGEGRMRAALTAARETAWPLLGATVIACLAFLPIYLAPTTGGEYCASLFQVVAISLLLSWILAMTQTPVFCHYFLRVKAEAREVEPHSGRFYRSYRRILDRALRRRVRVLIGMVALLVLAGLGFGFVPKMFFADSDKNQFFVDYWLPEGSRIERLSLDMARAEQHLMALPEVVDVTSCVGSGPPRFAASVTPQEPNDSYGQFVVNVHDYRRIQALIPDLETWFAENLPQGELHITRYISGPSADYKIEARICGPDPRVLRDLAEQAKTVMRADPRSRSVRDDWRQRTPVWEPVYSQERARRAGVERGDLAAALLSTTDGRPVNVYREGDELLPVRVTYCTPDSSQLAGLSGTPVWGTGPASVPLGQVVSSTELTWEDPVVRRYNRNRVIRAQCESAPGVMAATLLADLQPAIEAIELPVGYTLEWEGEHELSVRGNAGVQEYMPLALMLMVVILVSLFNAFRPPLIIVLTVPLAVVGMVVGLLLAGQPFGFLAMLGAYSLIGMLIKNAVILIDQIRHDIQAGNEPLQAVREASLGRLRPVMMASLTTILGMIPLLTDAMFVSMAVTIMFGLAFATVLTLIVVPVLYTIFYRIRTT